jgi:hypothetical protein
VVLLSENKESFGLPGLAGGVLTAVLVLLFYGFFLLCFELGSLIVVAGLEHFALMMLGTPRSFSVTLRAHSLGTSAYLTGLLPFCSWYVFPIWSIVLRIFAMLHLHKSTGGQAVGAVLLPIGLMCGGLFAFYLAVIGLAVGLSR